MSTYTNILYQIVFGTKYRKHILTKDARDQLYAYMAGVIRNKNCFVHIINGVEDHVHILIDLHPSVSLSSLVKDIKVSSSLYIKENKLFPEFIGWQRGYGAFTYSTKEKERVINYIKRQEEHHRRKSFYKEYVALLMENQIQFEEKYLFEVQPLQG
jgi:REP element-mobilizing transposase RayT